MDAYHNMSAPPRTTVKMVVRPIGKQIVFDAGCTGVGVAYNGEKTDQQRDADIRNWFEDFVRRHKAELDAVPRRELRLTVNSVSDTIGFPAKYFPQFGGTS